MMTYNICKTCGACDGRAGILINDECQNCHKTRTTGEACVYLELSRTDEELQRTFGILKEGDQ
jgi:hypothetical protein